MDIPSLDTCHVPKSKLAITVCTHWTKAIIVLSYPPVVYTWLTLLHARAQQAH